MSDVAVEAEVVVCVSYNLHVIYFDVLFFSKLKSKTISLNVLIN